MSARDRILGRVRAAVLARDRTEHPGVFAGWRPDAGERSALQRFTQLFESAGGEVEVRPGSDDLLDWLAGFCRDFDSVCFGATVPDRLRPSLPTLPPDRAALGVSMAPGAIAETGSLILDARDGRQAQLLPPAHLVFVNERDIHETFRDALLHLRGDLPSAIGLHSGPSKSADIGRYLVRGVHGPGRVVAVVSGHSLTDLS